MHIKKCIPILLLCCFLQVTGMSQMRYEDLDKYSKSINEIQNRAQPVITGGHTITFPEENFIYLLTSKRFSQANFIERDNSETLFATEIDFVIASEIYYNRDGSGPEFINVTFEENNLLEIRQDGKDSHAPSNVLHFYFNNRNRDDRAQLFNDLAELIFLSKVNANPANKSKLNSELSSWKKAAQSNDFVKYTEFIKSYPNSIFLREANNRVENIGSNSTAITDYFKTYFAGNGRGKKYKELWGNWELGTKISNHSGKSKDISQQYLDENTYKVNKPNKHTYHYADAFFEYYSHDLLVRDDQKYSKRNSIEINRKTDLTPLAVGINKNGEVIYLAYRVKSKNDLPWHDIADYLGVQADKKTSSGNNEFHAWYFDDCTVVYVAVDFDPFTMIGRAKGDMKDAVTIHFHNKNKAIPSSTFKLNSGGKVYQISPEFWEKMIKKYQ
jgi:hypothetical protein